MDVYTGLTAITSFGEVFELGSQLIRKKWLNHLQDIGFSGVMRTCLRRSSGSFTDWKSDPNIAGEIASQLKLQAAMRRLRMLLLKAGMGKRSSNNCPLT